MFVLNCFSMVAIVVATVFVSLITIGRSGGFCDWKWMKNGANPNMRVREGCNFLWRREKSVSVCVKGNTPHRLVLPFLPSVKF